MASSPPNKLFPEQRGFPTPNAAPDITTCRVFSVPDDEEYLALLMGALDALIHPYNWYRNGDLTEDEASEVFAEIIRKAYAQALTGQCAPNIPAPYWDSAADVGAELPADEQIWYGKAGSFEEDLQLWILQGAIVLTFGLAGVKPAIRFATVYRKFLLEYKNDHIGAIIHFFIDSFEVFTATDTGDGSVSRVKIVADPDIDTHEIQIQADEGNGLSIIRKELSPDEVTPANQRYDGSCDCVQTTPDDGTTWIDAPGLDARHGDSFRLPAGGSGDDYLCNVAARITAQFKETLQEFLSALSIGSFATVVLGFLELLSPFVAPLVDLILLIYSALVAIGTPVIEAAFDDAVWHGIECIIRCNLRADGSLSADSVTAIKAGIFAAYPGTVSDVVSILFTLYGEVLSSNAGVERSETGDCTDCNCLRCYEWDFAVSDGGWIAPPIGGGLARGLYYPGLGWGGDPTNTDFPHQIIITNSATAVEIHSEEVFWSQTTYDLLGRLQVSIVNAGVLAWYSGDLHLADGLNADLRFPNSTGDTVAINRLNADGSAVGYVTKFRIEYYAAFVPFTGGAEC